VGTSRELYHGEHVARVVYRIVRNNCTSDSNSFCQTVSCFTTGNRDYCSKNSDRRKYCILSENFSFHNT